MNKTDILSALDEEISRLRQARDLLADASLPTRNVTGLKAAAESLVGEQPPKRGPGRPKGSVSKSKPGAAAAKKPAGKSGSDDSKEPTVKRRTMSAEGKARIAAAQRERWARQNGAAEKPTSAAKKAAKKAAPAKANGAKAAKKAPPAKAAKTAKKAPVKARGPYKKAAKASARPAAETGSTQPELEAAE